jgi:hypothetical protein
MHVSLKIVLVTIFVAWSAVLLAVVLSVMLSKSEATHSQLLQLLTRETIASVHQAVSHQVTRGVEPAVSGTRIISALGSPYKPGSPPAKMRPEARAAARGLELPSVRITSWTLLNSSSETIAMQRYQSAFVYLGLRGLGSQSPSRPARRPNATDVLDYFVTPCIYADRSVILAQWSLTDSIHANSVIYGGSKSAAGFSRGLVVPQQVVGTVYDGIDLTQWRENRTKSALSGDTVTRVTTDLMPGGYFWDEAWNNIKGGDAAITYRIPGVITLSGNRSNMLYVAMGREDAERSGELSAVCGGVVIGARLEAAMLGVLEPLVASSPEYTRLFEKQRKNNFARRPATNATVEPPSVQPQVFLLDGLGTVIASHTAPFEYYATTLPSGADPLEKRVGCVRTPGSFTIACRKFLADHPDYELLRQAQIQLGLNLTDIRDAVRRGNRTRNEGVESSIVTGVVTDPRLDGNVEYDVNFVHLRSLYPTVDHFSILVFMPRDFLRGPIARARNTAIGVSVALVVVALALAVAAAYMVGREVDELTREMADPWRIEGKSLLQQRLSRRPSQRTSSTNDGSGPTSPRWLFAELEDVIDPFLDMLEQVRTVRAFINVDVLRPKSINSANRTGGDEQKDRAVQLPATQVLSGSIPLSQVGSSSSGGGGVVGDERLTAARYSIPQRSDIERSLGISAASSGSGREAARSSDSGRMNALDVFAAAASAAAAGGADRSLRSSLSSSLSDRDTNSESGRSSSGAQRRRVRFSSAAVTEHEIPSIEQQQRDGAHAAAAAAASSSSSSSGDDAEDAPDSGNDPASTQPAADRDGDDDANDGSAAAIAGAPMSPNRVALLRHLEKQRLAGDIHNLRRVGMRVMCVAWCDFPIMGKMVDAIDRGYFIVKKQPPAHGQSAIAAVAATRHAALEDVITVSRAIARCCTTLLEKHPVSCIEYIGDALVLCFSIRNLAKKSRILCQLLAAIMMETLRIQHLKLQCVWPHILDVPKPPPPVPVPQAPSSAVAAPAQEHDPASLWERPGGGALACSILVTVGVFVGAARPLSVDGVGLHSSSESLSRNIPSVAAASSPSGDRVAASPPPSLEPVVLLDGSSSASSRPHSVLGSAVENARRISLMMLQHEGSGTVADASFKSSPVFPPDVAETTRGHDYKELYRRAFLGGGRDENGVAARRFVASRREGESSTAAAAAEHGARSPPQDPGRRDSREIDEEKLCDIGLHDSRLQLSKMTLTGCLGNAIGIPLSLVPLLANSTVMGARPHKSQQEARRLCRAVLRAPIVHPQRLVALQERADLRESPEDSVTTGEDDPRSRFMLLDDALSARHGDARRQRNRRHETSADASTSVRMSIVRVVPTPAILLPPSRSTEKLGEQ